MNKKNSDKSVSHHVAGTASANRESVNREPPAEAGLASLDLAQVQYEKAKRELAREPNLEPLEPGIDPTLPTNPVYGEPGHQVPDAPNEDEDEEGRSIAEQLVEEGAEQAEQDTVSRAARIRERAIDTSRIFPGRRIAPDAGFTD